MTDPAGEADPNLFRVFASQETRQILEALLEGGLRQKALAAELRVSPQVVGHAVSRLEAAGLVARTSARGEVYLIRYDEVAKLLELEAHLTASIQRERSERSEARLRHLRKRMLRGRSNFAQKHS